MADYINNVAAADAYTPALSLGPNFDARTAVITVANNSALMQFAVGKIGDWRWTDEREYFSIPQSFRVGNIIGVRFRNANAGQVARILCTLSGEDDIQFESGLPFTGTLSASGGVSSDVIIPTVALAAFPPANPQDGLLIELVLPASFDPVGGKSIRWLLTYNATDNAWDFVGGPPLYKSAAGGAFAAQGGAYVASGLAFAVPRPGDWKAIVTATLNGANGGINFGLGKDGAGAPVVAESGNGQNFEPRTHIADIANVAATLTFYHQDVNAGGTSSGLQHGLFTPVRLT